MSDRIDPDLREALHTAVGTAGLRDAPDDLTFYGADRCRGDWPVQPGLVVMPKSVEQVQAVVRACGAHGAAIVPSGGRTGLAGAATATGGEIVLALDRMNRVFEVDAAARTVRCEAGATVEQARTAAAECGLLYPVDYASTGTSQVGGSIATNAGGVKVIRYGLTRHWVLGLEVVSGAGDVLDLDDALEKNNTGLDLRQLFIGSEGTLGVICGATLKLTRPAGHLDVFFFAVRDLAAVLGLFEAARSGPFEVSAFEMLTDRCLARLREHRGIGSPLEGAHPYYVLLEVEAPDRERLDEWLGGLVEQERVEDGTLAANHEQAAHLWSLREGISESLSATGLPHKNDIALPIARLPAFCAEL